MTLCNLFTLILLTTPDYSNKRKHQRNRMLKKLNFKLYINYDRRNSKRNYGW